MRGYVGITDLDWYTFLQSGPHLEEVNFWQPSAHHLLDPPAGMPFFFKLRREHGGMIVGFAFFSWRTRLPAWMAWNVFGAFNGAADRASMLARISRLRKDGAIDPTGGYEIGCLVLVRPVFLPESRWVTPPADWPRTGVQRGKGYDLTSGEGLRFYNECLAAAGQADPQEVEGVRVVAQPTDRYGQPVLMRRRLGQGGFRVAIADVYRRKCAISDEHSLPVLEAAHIRPYCDGGLHEIRNGLLLRADIHRLFDQGFITVTPDYQVKVSRRLRDDYENGVIYYDLEDRVRASGGIWRPQNPEHQPDREALEWHSSVRFVA